MPEDLAEFPADPQPRLIRASARWPLLVLIPGLLSIDLVNGLLFPPGRSGGATAASIPLSPGTLVRGVLILVALIIAARSKTAPLRPMKRGLSILLVLGCLGPLVGYSLDGSVHALIANLLALSKIVYAPAMVVLFAALFRRCAVSLEDVLAAIAYTGTFASLSIVIADVLGIGLATYEWQQAGSKGLFISQNELGLTMGIALFAGVQALLSTGRFRYGAASLLTIPGMLLLGTRAAALGAVAAPLGVLAVNAPRFLRRHRARLIVIGAIVMATVSVGGIWEYQMVRSEQFQQRKFGALVSSDVVLVRALLLAGAFGYMVHRPKVLDVLGEGAVRYDAGVSRVLRMPQQGGGAEVDWADLIGAYGLLFAAALYTYYIRFLRKMRSLGRAYGSGVRWSVLMALGWFLAHSLIAGHALGPMPAGTIAPLLAFTWLIAEGNAGMGRVMEQAPAERTIDDNV